VIVIAVGTVAVALWASAVDQRATQAQRGLTNEVPDEWQQRIAQDYPGWQAIGFLEAPLDDPDKPGQTDYELTIVPPGERFSIGVSYESYHSNPPRSDDEVLRAGGSMHAQAESLLAYLKANYVEKGKVVDSLSSDNYGTVTLTWRPQGSALDAFGGIDQIQWDAAGKKWWR